MALAITAMTPGYLTRAKTVTVSGTVTNTSGGTLTGLTVQLRSSGTPISSRDGLQVYADGATVADVPVAGATTTISASLAPQATAPWSITLRPKQLGLVSFGVYPLAAEADSAAGNALVTSRTFLPYWPGKRALDPVRQDIAWIWPLIGRPGAVRLRQRPADQRPGQQLRPRRQAGRAARQQAGPTPAART